MLFIFTAEFFSTPLSFIPEPHAPHPTPGPGKGGKTLCLFHNGVGPLEGKPDVTELSALIQKCKGVVGCYFVERVIESDE